MKWLGSARLSCARCVIIYTLALPPLLASRATAENLRIPPRPSNAPSGLQFARSLEGLDLRARDEKIFNAVLSGNVPAFLRQLVPVSVTNVVGSRTNTAVFFVTPDYLAIGSDTNYFLAPVSPETAQRIADALNCSLPTPLMVDAIYKAAALKLEPAPIPPGPGMATIPAFITHNEIIKTQRLSHAISSPLGFLVAGHKKDLVISSRLDGAPAKVAIYGWHKTNGNPIQPLYLGHSSSWVDYSQCLRLVLEKIYINAKSSTVSEILNDNELARLLSDEGPIGNPRYPTNDLRHGPIPLKNFIDSKIFAEQTATFSLEPELRVHVNAPSAESFTNTHVMLIFFALPNGNTIEQTVGKTLSPGEDWHYNIQHIGAQIRFLRQALPSKSVVVAYFESNQKSWPAWRKKYGDDQIPKIFSNVSGIFSGMDRETILASHSGGGSMIFGYLNAVQSIPEEISRIAFIDSNYAYDSKLSHDLKLAKWLTNSPNHYLTVLAYNDAVALLDGKSFVSAAGGTWGKSHQMQKGLAAHFHFDFSESAEFERYLALDGRVQFLLKNNPDRKILHTVQVELNGLIHSVLAGTPLESRGYSYFGPRAYDQWISRIPN